MEYDIRKQTHPEEEVGQSEDEQTAGESEDEQSVGGLSPLTPHMLIQGMSRKKKMKCREWSLLHHRREIWMNI
jgi:hypothetical protein